MNKKLLGKSTSIIIICLLVTGLHLSAQIPTGKSVSTNDWIKLREGEAALIVGDLELGYHHLSQIGMDLVLGESYEAYVRSQILLASVCFNSGRYREMGQPLDNCLEVARVSLDQNHWVWEVAAQLKCAYLDHVGDYDGALEQCHEALNIFQAAGIESYVDSVYMSSLYNNLGALYYSKGDYQRAVDFYEEVIRINEKPSTGLDTAGLVNSYLNLSTGLRKLGQFNEAVAAIQRSYELSEADQSAYLYNDRRDILEVLGLCYRDQGNYPLALKYLSESLQLALEKQKLVGKVYRAKGRTYYLMGKHQAAVKELKTSLTHLEQQYGKIHPELASAYEYLGHAYMGLAKPQLAANAYQSGLKSLSQEFNSDNLAENPASSAVFARQDYWDLLASKAACLFQLANDYPAEPGYWEAADKSYESAAELVIQMQKDLISHKAKTVFQVSVRRLFEGAIAVKENLYQQSGNPGHLEQAFRLAEQSKSMLLKEEMRSARALHQAGIPDSLLQRAQDLQAERSVLQRMIFEASLPNNSDSAKVKLWNQKYFQLSREYEALMTKVEGQFPIYFQQKHQNQITDLQALQSRLAMDSTQMIAYFYGQERCFAFGIQASGLQMESWERNQDLDSSLIHFFQEVKDPYRATRSQKDFQRFCSQSFALYQQFLARFSLSESKRLLIVPDAWLGYLPFELLLAESPKDSSTVDYGKLSYLIKSHSIHYAYSASLWIQEPITATYQNDFLGFAPQYIQGEEGKEGTLRNNQIEDCRKLAEAFVPDLPHVKPEVRGIVDLIGGKALVDGEAKERIFKQKAPSTRLIHLAMHALVNECDPLYSRLVFATESPSEEEDGQLFAYELHQMTLPAELAVLSACETGFGKMREGDGMMSLGRAFRSAGCQSIVMSLWQAEDQSTRFMMEAFYESLKKGKRKDEALRAAKLQYLEEVHRNHPFYWSAFVLIGAPESIEMSFSMTNLSFLLITGFLLIPGLILWLRQKQKSAKN